MNRKVLLLIILVPVGFIITAFTVACGWLFFSAGPIELMAEAMRKDGIVVTGIGGSLNSGVTFEKMTYNTPNANIELDDVEFRYSGMMDLFMNRQLVIENIQTTSALIDVKKIVPSKKRARQRGSSKPTESHEKDTEEQKPLEQAFNDLFNDYDGLREFRIKRIAIGNVRVKTPLQDVPFTIDKGTLTQMVMKKGYISVEAFELLCSVINLKGGQILFENSEWSLSEPISGSVKPAAFPMIKKDLSFAVAGKYNVQHKKGNGSVDLFDGKLLMKVMPDGKVNLVTKDLSPGDYLTTNFPMSRMDIELTAKSVEAAMQEIIVKGKYNVGRIRFQLEPSAQFQTLMPGVPEQSFSPLGGKIHGVFIQNQSRIDMFISPTALMLGAGSSGLFDIKSNFSTETIQILSVLNFGQFVQTLAPEQIETVRGQMGWFIPTGTLSNMDPSAFGRGPAAAIVPQPHVAASPHQVPRPTLPPVSKNGLPAYQPRQPMPPQPQSMNKVVPAAATKK